MTAHSPKIRSTLALTAALGALAPAAAAARPLPADPPSSSTVPNTSSQPYVLKGTHDVGTTTQPAPAQVVQVTPSGGFDWGDAGIGAAGAIGLTMLAMGGVGIARHRGRHAHRPTGATS
jgi:hypothetical protein